MMLTAGQLNRVVRVEKRVMVVDPEYGTQTESWVSLGVARAQVQDVLPSRGEGAANGINIQLRPARVRMRWRTDIDASMRLIYLDRGGRIMEVVTQPAELGQREGIEFMVQEYSARGDI